VPPIKDGQQLIEMSEPKPTPSKFSPRALATVIAVLVPLVPIVIALGLTGGGGSAAPARAGTGAAPTFAPAAAPQPSATTTQAPAPKPAGLKLPAGPGVLVAQLKHPTALHARPGGRVVARLATKTGFGSPEVLWVAQRSGHWLGVVTPQTGNNRIGWISASGVSLNRVTWELRASLSARKVTVLNDGKVVQRYTVAVGAPTAPTPTGRFAVTDRLLTGNPAGPYGCCILALSAKAPHAIQDWSGGDRIAIHSTPESDTIGEAVSHGCMRLTLAEGRWLINHIPLGTPTYITS
jgi:lipoprotein-anchoring transpeptidase ErfK/SrfK